MNSIAKQKFYFINKLLTNIYNSVENLIFKLLLYKHILVKKDLNQIL